MHVKTILVVLLALVLCACGQRRFCVRRDVLDVSQNRPEEWSILVLSMRAIQQANISSPESFFQIAGIHGQPYVEYIGVSNPDDPFTGVPRWGGYCHHANTIFPTWHRPYVTLIEAALRNVARRIAASYPRKVRSKYRAAAESLCMPFWDYAGPETASNGVPTVLTDIQLTIETPNGTQSVPNPFVAYTLQATVGFENTTYPDRINAGQSTTRHPADINNPVTNNEALNTAIRAYALEWGFRFFDVLLNTDWACWSNTTPNATCPITSMEDVHNGAHRFLGGPGLPGVLPGPIGRAATAGFDPIFYMLHSNTDRHLALYQVLRPQTYVTPSLDPRGSWTNRINATVDANFPLAPFFRNNIFTARPPGTNPLNDLYTSNDIRDFQALGYTYSDLEDNPTPDQLYARLRTRYTGNRPNATWMVTLEEVQMNNLMMAVQSQMATNGGGQNTNPGRIAGSIVINLYFRNNFAGGTGLFMPAEEEGGAFRSGFDMTAIFRNQSIDADVGFKDPKMGPSSGSARVPFTMSDLSFTVVSSVGVLNNVNLGPVCFVWMYEDRAAQDQGQGTDYQGRRNRKEGQGSSSQSRRSRQGAQGMQTQVYFDKVCPPGTTAMSTVVQSNNAATAGRK